MPRTKQRFLKQTFQARELPEAIMDSDGETVIGPFCFHCGNPLSLHGPKLRCPDQHLSPLFPVPNLPFAPVPE